MKKNDDLALDFELEINDAVDQYKDEAVKNAVYAFNEGYMLGRKHAERVFGGGENGGA
jgi:hypothetical protein